MVFTDANFKDHHYLCDKCNIHEPDEKKSITMFGATVSECKWCKRKIMVNPHSRVEEWRA